MARLAAGAGGTAIQAAVRAVALEDSGPSCPVSHGEPRDLGRLQCVIPLDRSTRPTVQADSAVYSHAASGSDDHQTAIWIILAVILAAGIAAVLIQRFFTAYLPPVWGWFTLAWMRRREYV